MDRRSARRVEALAISAAMVPRSCPWQARRPDRAFWILPPRRAAPAAGPSTDDRADCDRGRPANRQSLPSLFQLADLGARCSQGSMPRRKPLLPLCSSHRCGGSPTRSPPVKPCRQPARLELGDVAAIDERRLPDDRVMRAIPAEPVKPVSQARRSAHAGTYSPLNSSARGRESHRFKAGETWHAAQKRDRGRIAAWR
jgi:hypothetical protein